MTYLDFSLVISLLAFTTVIMNMFFVLSFRFYRFFYSQVSELYSGVFFVNSLPVN